MTGWLIAVGILFLIVLLLCMPVRISVCYAGEKDGGSRPEVWLHLLFFRFRLYPKNKKIRLKDYQIKRLRKKGRKLKKKPEKAAKKAKKRTQGTEKRDFKATAYLIKELIRVLAGKLQRYLRISIGFAEIRVVGRDAAETAVLYGILIQAAAGICAILTNYLHVSTDDCRNIRIVADYTAQQWSAAFELAARLRLWQLLSVLVSAGLVFVRQPSGSDTEEKKAREKAARAEIVKELRS